MAGYPATISAGNDITGPSKSGDTVVDAEVDSKIKSICRGC